MLMNAALQRILRRRAPAGIVRSLKPCSRNLVRDWWYRAERLAGLEHVKQMGWHSFRRKFTTELKANTNLKDLCALGGWKNPQTILTCYMQADEESMREALARRKPLAAAAG